MSNNPSQETVEHISAVVQGDFVGAPNSFSDDDEEVKQREPDSGQNYLRDLGSIQCIASQTAQEPHELFQQCPERGTKDVKEETAAVSQVTKVDEREKQAKKGAKQSTANDEHPRAPVVPKGKKPKRPKGLDRFQRHRNRSTVSTTAGLAQGLPSEKFGRTAPLKNELRSPGAHHSTSLISLNVQDQAEEKEDVEVEPELIPPALVEAHLVETEADLPEEAAPEQIIIEAAKVDPRRTKFLVAGLVFIVFTMAAMSMGVSLSASRPSAAPNPTAAPATNSSYVATPWPVNAPTAPSSTHTATTFSPTLEVATNPLDNYIGDTFATRLDLHYDLLGGTVPKEIGLMTALTYLSLAINNLDGTLPTELGLLTALTVLSLRDNNFEGSIPTELGMLTKLTFLGLHYNNFSGTVPTEIALLRDMQMLYFHQNADLVGTIPSGLCALTSLTTLWLDCSNVECSVGCRCIDKTGYFC